MDNAHKERLEEEAKQSRMGAILEKAVSPSLADALTLRDELIKVGIAEAGTVRGMVDQIFEVACTNPETSLTLAELCQIMPAHFEPVEVAPAPKEKGAGSRGTSEKRIDLRLMVVKKCKEELEKGVAASKAVKAWEDKEAQKELNGEDKRAAEVDRKARERMLELIRFCGNLYNQGLVSEKIIHSCIETLLKDEDEPRFEDMETLTALLKSIGGKLEESSKNSKSSKDGKIVAEYYKRMDKMKENAVSQQLATMLGEVLDLKSRGWVAAA